MAVVAVHGDRCGLALMQPSIAGRCIKELRGSSFLFLWLGHPSGKCKLGVWIISIWERHWTKSPTSHAPVPDNFDAKDSGGNCLCFVLERITGSVPNERPLICFINEGNAGKNLLEYSFLYFLRQDEVHKPSRSWQHLISVVYTHVLPQSFSMFVRAAVLSGFFLSICCPLDPHTCCGHSQDSSTALLLLWFDCWANLISNMIMIWSNMI